MVLTYVMICRCYKQAESNDEVVFRLRDGKAVTAEAVGNVNLVISDRVRLELKDCYLIWHARLGHISQDRIKRLVGSKSLEIDNLDNLPAYESCLKEKITRKPFVGQSTLANSLLDLIHTDVCGPLNTQARGEFSYFITFSNDRSRYGYVYLMRNKYEAFMRLSEGKWYSFSVDTSPGRLSLMAWLKGGTGLYKHGPVHMMSFTELALSFWGYALETAARLLIIAPSKSVAQTPYQIWHGKPASYKFIGYPKGTTGYYFYDPSEQKVFVSRNAVFLERGFPADTRRDELLLEESSEAPQFNVGTSSARIASTDNVPVLRRSARVPQPPERYGFLGVTGQLNSDPKTYRKAMSDIDTEKSREAMKSKMDSMSSNQIWTLVDGPKGVKPVGVSQSINVRLVLMGSHGQVHTIMLAIAAWYDYEIWQTDVKTAFLNGFVEEEIYMDQSEGFTIVGEEQKVFHLQRSIYGLKQASRSWNIRFDEVIRGYDFVKNDFDPCVCKKVSASSIAFLVLYVDDILLIENDVKMLGDNKTWLSTQFSMKNLGEASYILGIKIFRDRSKRMLGMTKN
ncbi:UNVERIFIED_CONTAM: hypothetical protein Slati_4523900 [Sesamum latifolium]|uniref:Uncharacterized protein n=1 Tax=Sesamum latifolium TaxID=2727402 RepID=A0AAW2SHP2_9LAMI